MRIGLTGHSGFVGRAVHAELRRHGHEVVELVRVPRDTLLRSSEAGSRGAPDRVTTELRRGLEGLDLVVNCAGKTAVRAQRNDESYLANLLLPAYIYRQSVGAAVPSFIHISSVAAVGSRTGPRAPLSDQDPASPDNAYGDSKLAGDEYLLRIAEPSTALAVLRPPILYGAQGRGVFKILKTAAQFGIPLPIGGLRNLRSFMFIDNLASAIVATAEHALTGAYIVTDHKPMMPAELYDLMTAAAGRGKRSFTLSHRLVSLGAKLVLGGRSESLLGNAVYDDTRFRRDTGWEPPYSLSTAIKAVMRY